MFLDQRRSALISGSSLSPLRGRHFPDEEIEAVVADATWYPEYVPVVSTEKGR